MAIVESPYETLPDDFIQDFDIEAGEFVFVLYAHLKDGKQPVIGQGLEAGNVLGEIGSTGNSDGEHLHLEIRVGETGTFKPGSFIWDSGVNYSRSDAWFNMEVINPRQVDYALTVE